MINVAEKQVQNEFDELVTAVSSDGLVSVKAIRGTNLVAHSAMIHRTYPVAAAALGRCLLASILIANGKKNDETVQLEFRGDGPLKSVVATSDSEGRTRGYVGNAQVHLPLTPGGKLDVGKAVGRGFLTVVRNHASWLQPYRGITEIVTGEIGDDVLNYLVQSEQVPSALALGVFVEPQGVTAAGGYLVQMLPGATEETLKCVERNVMALNARGSPTRLLRKGTNPGEMVDALLDGMQVDRFEHGKPSYYCGCSYDRVKRALALLPRSEILTILEKRGDIEVICEFCQEKYRLLPEELAPHGA